MAKCWIVRTLTVPPNAIPNTLHYSTGRAESWEAFANEEQARQHISDKVSPGVSCTLFEVASRKMFRAVKTITEEEF